MVKKMRYSGEHMETILIIAVLILSIVLHEMAHGYAANWLGDPTARLQGRLSGNPLVHMDPIGSVLVPGLLFLSGTSILFGWAKPVPYNPYNLRNAKWGEAIVAAAGPAINIFLAVFFAMLIRFAPLLGLPASFLEIASYAVFINLLLAFFNMIPFPPLDGSKILKAFLPFNAARQYDDFLMKVQSFGLLFTFLFIFLFINIFWEPFSQFVGAIFTLLTGTRLF